VQVAGHEERKRESIMVGFSAAKGRAATAEESLARARVDLEKGAFELAAKQGEIGCLVGGCWGGGRGWNVVGSLNHTEGVGSVRVGWA
jgi:hypothetical protein